MELKRHMATKDVSAEGILGVWCDGGRDFLLLSANRKGFNKQLSSVSIATG